MNIKFFALVTVLLVFSLAANGQSKLPTTLSSFAFSDFGENLFKDYTLKFKATNVSKTTNYLSLHNPITNLSDVYGHNGSDIVYLRARPNFENSARRYKIDSFNPHGTHNIGNAILSGVLNELFN